MTDYQKAREAAAEAISSEYARYGFRSSRDMIAAALSAFEAHGLVLVPAIPSSAMCDAGKSAGEVEDENQDGDLEVCGIDPMACYVAMVNSALQERQKKPENST